MDAVDNKILNLKREQVLRDALIKVSKQGWEPTEGVFVDSDCKECCAIGAILVDEGKTDDYFEPFCPEGAAILARRLYFTGGYSEGSEMDIWTDGLIDAFDGGGVIDDGDDDSVCSTQEYIDGYEVGAKLRKEFIVNKENYKNN